MRRRRSGPISVQLAVSTIVMGAVLTGLAGVAPLRRAAAAEKATAERPAGDKTATEKAREHFRSGEAFFKLEKYQEALSEYEQGYIAKSDPSFLYNIAQCHRLMGNKQAALRFYKRFLTEATRVPNREMVETHIRDLEKALAKSHASSATEPPAGAAAGETAAPPPPPTSPPAASSSSSPNAAATPPAAATPRPSAGGAPPVVLSAPPPGYAPIIDDGPPSGPAASPDRPPIYKRWWFWTAIGAVALAGGITALVLTNDKGPSCEPGRICM